MRVISVILTIFLLGLISFPCCSEEVEEPGHSHEMSVMGENHDHALDFDFCSPFSPCHCCHTHITALEAPLMDNGIETPQNPSMHKVDHLPSMAYAIWQPPKI